MPKPPVPLEHRVVGRTGGATSILGLGTRRLVEAGQQGTIKLVREAIDGGVTLLEVAPEYGDGRTERWIGLALREGYRERVQLLWQCCAHQRDYKTSMLQFETTLGHLKTDRVEFWSFHEVIYDNDPEWMYEHGGMDAAQEAREQKRVRWIGFHGEKSPHIALRLLARGFAWDFACMPLNPFDATFRSFEKQLLPEMIRRGAAVFGTKPFAGGAIPAGRLIKPEEALRYVWSLPVSSVLAGCDSVAVLKKTLKGAAGFTAFHPGEMDALRQRAKPTAGDGRFERYKTTQEYDGKPGLTAHGFKP